MVSANGARFHVAGMGGGPLVLFLHGFPEFWWAWRHQLTVVAAAGFRAVAMDLRGYGASDKPPRGYDPMTAAADVAGVIRSLGARDAVVVGHGWGGVVAWSAATLHRDQVRRIAVVSTPHPSCLRKAHLSDPAQLRASRHVLAFQRPFLPERSLVRNDAALVGRLLRSWSRPGWPDVEADRRYRAAFQIAGVANCALEPYRWAVRSVARSDGMRYAQQMRRPVTTPVLQLHGADDPVLLETSAQPSAGYVDAPYRWHGMRGVGHFPHEESPDDVNDQLVAWLRDSAAPG